MISTFQRLKLENEKLRRRNAFGDCLVLGTCIAVAIAFVMGWL